VDAGVSTAPAHKKLDKIANAKAMRSMTKCFIFRCVGPACAALSTLYGANFNGRSPFDSAGTRRNFLTRPSPSGESSARTCSGRSNGLYQR
jgi:hypothetical protein